MSGYRAHVLTDDEPPAPRGRPAISSAAEGVMSYSLNDPFLLDFMREGMEAASGAHVSVKTALRNPAMFRAVSLISGSIGMLPLQVINEETKQKATDHPLYRLLHRQPNNWQSAFDFRSLMQLRALTSDRPACALVIRSRQIRTGRDEVVRLIPLDPARVTAKQRPDWSVVYEYQPAEGGLRTYAPEEILHIRGLSFDGINGVNLVRQAREAIGLALTSHLAAGRLFKNGVMAGGALTHPDKLSDEAFERLKRSVEEKEGAENAGQTFIFEEGMTWAARSGTAKDSQMLEIMKLMVEEIARVTGVPRPLLMVDETSWGSGITALGQFFVMYALNMWFEAWQQACERVLLRDDEKDRFAIKFNPGALLRGSVKEQGDFFAKALGSGGGPGWMKPNEIRRLNDLPDDDDGNTLHKGSGVPDSDGGDDDAPEPTPPVR